MGKGMFWLRASEGKKPGGAPAPAPPPLGGVKRMILTTGGPVTSPGLLPATAPVQLEPEERDAMIAQALAVAGANELPDGPRAWLWGRVGTFGLNAEGWNLGGLRPARIGCGCKGAAAFESFPSIGAGAEALVDVARRAGASAEAPAPDLLPVGDLDEAGRWHAYWKTGPYVDQQGRTCQGWHAHPKGTPEAVAGPGVYSSSDPPEGPIEVGWIPGFGPDEAAQKLYQQLRADWAGFKTAGVGTGKLAFLAPTVEVWNKFSNGWETSDAWYSNFPVSSFHSSDLGEPKELGARLNAMVMDANRVRAEIATLATGTPIAPGDLPGTRKGFDDAPGANWFGKQAEKVDSAATSNAVLDWLTAPKQRPEDAAKRIGVVGLVLAAVLVGGALYLRPRAPSAPRREREDRR